MPELPEVETVRRGFKEVLLQKEVTGMNVFYSGIFFFESQVLTAIRFFLGINPLFT